MLPAIATRIVLFDLEKRFAKEREAAVKNDIELFFFLPLLTSSSGYFAKTWQFGQRANFSSTIAPHFGQRYFFFFSTSLPSYGLVSPVMTPSNILTIRVAYLLAKSGLWVTMMTKRSLATSLRRSMIWTLVSLSRAPVGSSAKRISGLLIKARAMATLCI